MNYTVGQILLKHSLPKELKSFADKTLDKKTIESLFKELSTHHPKQFNHIASEVARLGFEVSTREGSSVSLNDLESPIDKDKRFEELEKEIDKIKKRGLSKDKEDEEILEKYFEFTSTMDKDIVDEGLKHNKTLAKIIKAGARGSAAQYRSTVAAPGLVLDSKEKPLLNFPVKHSFAEGLSLPEYLTTSYGARHGEISKKMCYYVGGEILMSNFSRQKIKDVKIGDFIIGADKSQNSFKVKVTNIFDNGVQDCWKYIFRKGNSSIEKISIVATEDHRVLSTFRKYSKHSSKITDLHTLGEFKLGDKNFQHSVALPKEYLNKEGKNEFRALYLGLMLGDGCRVKKKNETSFVHGLSCNDPSLIADVKDYFKSLDLLFTKCKSNHTWRLSYIDKTNKKNNARLHSIKKWLKEINLLDTRAETKFIPEEVWEWDQESLANLVSGLISTDGSIGLLANNCMVIRFATVSEQVATTLRDILEKRFCIYCTRIKGSKNDVFRFVISHRYSVKKFIEQIKLVGIKKTELALVLEQFSKNNNYNFDQDYPCSFIKKEYIGKLPTIDLEVDHPDHLYLTADKIIIHNSTALSGFFGKQLSRSSTTIQVEEHDCGTDNGVPFSVDDNDSIGAFLAKPVSGYKKNNEITSDMLSELRNKKIENIIVRSPITCQSSRHFHAGAVCQLCVGVRENGLPSLGSFVGIISATALSEPLSQGMLSRKHSSGTASRTNTSEGFELINQLANIPKNFPGAATLTDHSGKITSIKKADVGGHYLTVDKTEHYVQPGFNIHVKVGDEVEAGDVLSEGIIDPSEIVKYKGIGEGRKHYVEAMHKAFKESGIGVNRRNFEIVAKNAINHVKIINPDGLGDYLPDQIVNYQAIEKNYRPREGSKLMRIDQTKDHYLEEPVLHYSIGTPISRAVINTLKKNNIESINVHSDKPGFEPVMHRLLDVPEHEEDIFHKLYSTYLAKRLSESVNTGKGSSSDLKGPSPILGLAYSKGFGSGQF